MGKESDEHRYSLTAQLKESWLKSYFWSSVSSCLLQKLNETTATANQSLAVSRASATL